MNVKTWLPICLALVLGVIAAKLANDAVSSRKGDNATAAVKLVVAKRPIAPGEALAAEDLEIRPIAADAPPEGAYTSPSDLVGRTAQAQLVKGQPVTESMLAPQGTASGLQALVPPGMRAMTVEVNEFSGVGGMVTPGSRVDVISIMQDPHLAESMSRTIVQNVLVKAVGQSTSTDTEKKDAIEIVKSVTLIVTPRQAEAIQLSTLSGRPWLILRGNGDSTVAALGGTTLTELRGAEAGHT
ncbi:MAG: Flp pilus assembly protein CpaB, partial [Tepidisphaeraceae bacterium]